MYPHCPVHNHIIYTTALYGYKYEVAISNLVEVSEVTVVAATFATTTAPAATFATRTATAATFATTTVAPAEAVVTITHQL